MTIIYTDSLVLPIRLFINIIRLHGCYVLSICGLGMVAITWSSEMFDHYDQIFVSCDKTYMLDPEKESGISVMPEPYMIVKKTGPQTTV